MVITFGNIDRIALYKVDRLKFDCMQFFDTVVSTFGGFNFDSAKANSQL